MFPFALVVAAFAESPPPDAPPAADVVADAVVAVDDEEARRQADAAAFEASLGWQRGDVVLGDGLATLHVPDDFRYLGPADADLLLQAWGNPPRPDTLGMLFPQEPSVFADEGWGLVVQYDADGHVSDDDAASIDYAGLLDEMKQATEDENAARTAQGYEAVHLTGWAEPPHYDAATRKIYWAKELDFVGSPAHTLNYDVRVLGRHGVLSMAAIASIDQLPVIREKMERIIGFVEFNPGNRYEDFDPSTDRMAAYGLAGLVAGGAIAAKTGLLKGLLAALIAGKKFVILAVVGLGASLRGFFARLRGQPPQQD